MTKLFVINHAAFSSKLSTASATLKTIAMEVMRITTLAELPAHERITESVDSVESINTQENLWK